MGLSKERSLCWDRRVAHANYFVHLGSAGDGSAYEWNKKIRYDGASDKAPTLYSTSFSFWLEEPTPENSE